MYAAELSRERVATVEGKTTYGLTASGKDVQYVVRFEESPFDKSGHKVEIEAGKTFIDGKYAWGTLGDEPKTQLTGFSVEMGGKAVDVPAELYYDLYDFLIAERESRRYNPSDWFVVRILDDGTLMVSSVGSYERGYYLVHWWIGGNAPPVRSIVTDKEEQRRWHREWKTTVPDRPAESTAGDQPARPARG
ncbi:MAG: hypothetical protein WD716_03640 [Fimbriimonadaceae bacterium]